jgi:hypothetical protein
VAFEVEQHAVRRAGGDVHVVGTVRNSGTLDASAVVITVSLLDDSGAVVASGESSTNLYFVEAGRVTPFSAPIEGAPEQWASERIEVTAEPMSSFLKDAFTHDIEPLDVRVVPRESVTDAPRVAGELRNASDMPLMLVKVIVAAYDADGTLLDVQSRTVLADPRLEPGQTTTFEVFFLRLDEVPAMDYVVEGVVAR